MHQMPASATIVKMILLTIAACPPKIRLTISNWNNPMEPQFSAPMITSIRAILSNIIITPFFNPIICITGRNIHFFMKHTEAKTKEETAAGITPENGTSAAAMRDRTAAASAQETAAKDGEKETETNYKKAFVIMTCLTVLLFVSLIAVLFLQRYALTAIDYYEESVVRVYTLPEETQGELLVNVNTADINELTLLPGIGEGRARDIIDYRNEYGMFTQPEDLLKIRGIGEATLEGILPFIVFEDPD